MERKRLEESRISHIPNGVVRKGRLFQQKCRFVPNFINLGAYVDEDTMIDTWASVGSCAKLEKIVISLEAQVLGCTEPSSWSSNY